MTLYAGESLQITMQGTADDGVIIDSTSGVTVTVSVFDTNAVTVVDEQQLSWNATEGVWVYQWDTVGRLPGTYVSKVTLTGLSGTISWEYKTIRLHKPRVVVA